MKICPSGDQGISVEFENEISEAVNGKVTALAGALAEQEGTGIMEMVPTYRALLIRYDPSSASYEELCGIIRLASVPGDGSQSRKRRVWRIPCCYGGIYGEDLEGMEGVTGLSSEEIIRIHTEPEYKIYMLGFLPGFPYLGGLDPRIAAPRLETPRVRIPAGSVGIGGSQTGIYPIDSPGGWRLIGRTPVKFYDPESEHPILCAAGDSIRFVSITPDEYKTIARDVEKRVYVPEKDVY